MATRVGSKGQVVIEKEIRDRLGVAPGWTAFQQLVDDHVEIRFFPPEHNRSLYGILAPHIEQPFGHLEWREIEDAAWGAADERAERLREDE